MHKLVKDTVLSQEHMQAALNDRNVYTLWPCNAIAINTVAVALR